MSIRLPQGGRARGFPEPGSEPSETPRSRADKQRDISPSKAEPQADRDVERTHRAPAKKSGEQTGLRAPRGQAQNRKSPGAVATQRLRRRIDEALRADAGAAGNGQRPALETTLGRLETALSQGKIDTAAESRRLATALRRTAVLLQQSHLDSAPVTEALRALQQRAVERVAADLGVAAQPFEVNGALVGISAPDASSAQRAVLAPLSSALLAGAQQQATPERLSTGDIMLLDLRGTLLRRANQMLLPKNGPPPAPEGVEQELRFIHNAAQQLDSMLANKANLPPNLLRDVQALTRAIEASSAPATQAASSPLTTAPSLPPSTATSAAESTRGAAALAGSFAARARALAQNQQTSPRAPRLPEAPSMPQPAAPAVSAPAAPSVGIGPTRAPSAPAAPSQPGRAPSAPGPLFDPQALGLNAMQSALLDTLGRAPHALHDDVGGVLQQYNTAMEQLHGALPDYMPFSYTLPQPMVYDDGAGTRFLLPAGSEVRQENGRYKVDAPGLMLASGGTTIVAEDGELDLGAQGDRLELQRATVEGNTFGAELSDVGAQINRDGSASFIRAERARVDTRNATVELHQAQMMHDPEGQLSVEAARMAMQTDAEQFSLENFRLEHTKQENTSRVSASGSRLELQSAATVLQAESIHGTFVQSTDPNAPETMSLQAMGVQLQQDGLSFDADSAAMEVVQDADGSSTTHLSGADLGLSSNEGTLQSDGHSSLALSYTAGGQLADATLSAEAISFSDSAGRQVAATNGNVRLDTHADGSLAQLQANAQSLRFTHGDAALSANGGDLSLAYADGHLRAVNAQADAATYRGTEGAFDSAHGTLSMRFGDNNQLRDLEMNAQQANFMAADGHDQAAARNGRLSISYGANGGLTNVGGAADTLAIQIGQTHLDAQDASLDATFANGHMRTLEAETGAVEATTASGTLSTQGRSRVGLTYGAPGALQQIEAASEHLRFSGGETRATVDGGRAALRFDRQGQLSQAQGRADALAVVTPAAELEGRDAALEADYDNGMLTRARASTGTAAARGDFGALELSAGGQAELDFDEQGRLRRLRGASGQVRFRDNAGGSTQISAGAADVLVAQDGSMQGFAASAGDVQWQGASGERLQARGADIEAAFGADGNLRQASAASGDLRYQGAAGSVTTSGRSRLSAEFGSNGSLTGMQASAEDVVYGSEHGNVHVADGTLQMQAQPDGSITRLDATTGTLSFTANGGTPAAGGLGVEAEATRLELVEDTDGSSAWRFGGDEVQLTTDTGQLQARGTTTIRLQSEADGTLSRARIRAEDLTYADATGGRLGVTGGHLDVHMHGDGAVARVNGQAETLQYTSDAGVLDAHAGELALDFEAGQLRAAQANASSVQLDGSIGKLQATEGDLQARFGAEGQLQELTADVNEGTYRNGEGARGSVQAGQLALGFDAAGGLARVDGDAARLDFDHAGMQLHAQATTLQARYQDGRLKRVSGGAGAVHVNGDFGQLAISNNAALALQYSDAGRLAQATSSLGEVRYTGQSGGELRAAGSTAQLRFDANEALRQARTRAGSLEWRQDDATTLAAKDATVELALRPDGQLSKARASTGELTYTGAMGQLNANGQTQLALDLRADGSVAGVNAEAEQLSHSQDGRRIELQGGQMRAAMSAQGSLQQLQLSAASGQLAGDFGRLDLAAGGGLQLAYGDGGSLESVQGDVSGLTYAGEAGRLNLSQARVDGTFRQNGSVEALTLSGEAIRFHGTGSGEHLSRAQFNAAEAVLTSTAAGGQSLRLSGHGGRFALEQHDLSVERIDALELHSDASGQITRAQLDVAGRVALRENDGTLQAQVTDLSGGYSRANSELDVRFEHGQVVLGGQGITAEVNDAHAALSQRQMRMFVGDARLLREVGDQLTFEAEVEGLELALRAGEEGALQAGELTLDRLQAATDDLSAYVRTPDGKRLRLGTRVDGDGQTIREVFWQLPEGGELNVSSDGNSATLGAMRGRLTRVQDGLRLSTEGLDVQGVWEGTTVDVDSEAIDVGLDAERGLVFHNITGSHIQVHTKERSYSLDIAEMDNLMLRMTGVSGLAQGASVALLPTDAGASELSLKMSTRYAGLPLTVELDDLGAFEAAAKVDVNQVQVYAGDPSGRGRIELGVGPLELNGEQIEAFARYREFNSNRMLASVGNYLSSDGVRLAEGFSVESDGVMRFGANAGALHGEMAIMLPRGPTAAPGYLLHNGVRDGDDRGGGGLMLGVGVGGEDASGARHTGSLFFGAMPGSYVEWEQTQGSAQLLGAPLPDRMTVPTTGVAGVQYRSHGETARLDAQAGAFYNPAAHGPEELVAEQTPAGLLGGIAFRKENVSVQAQAVLGADAQLQPDLQRSGVQLTLGLQY